MKRAVLAMVCWFLFLGAGKQTNWWVELITDPISGTVTKVNRGDYLEYQELNPKYEELGRLNDMEEFNRQYELDFKVYREWETNGKFEYTGPDRTFNYEKYDPRGIKNISIRK